MTMPLIFPPCFLDTQAQEALNGVDTARSKNTMHHFDGVGGMAGVPPRCGPNGPMRVSPFGFAKHRSEHRQVHDKDTDVHGNVEMSGCGTERD